MNRLKKIMIYTIPAGMTLLLAWAVSGVENNLDRIVQKEHLRFTGRIDNAPPLVAFTTVALGSFRGLIADFLWLRAGGLQEKGNYFEMVQLARWITDLQPNFSGATAYLAWNMAYNISVACSDFADRLRWVNEGIKLIRDRALDYNPEDPVLYKELGWIFQHKLGNVMDDANLYYKNRLAMDMTGVLGTSPDFGGMAAAPASLPQLAAKYGSNPACTAALEQAGMDGWEALYQAFKEGGGVLPEKFAGAVKDPGIAKDMENSFRGMYLREKYKLDPKVMDELNRKYGMLDWRVPESQALYWATMGLKKTPGHRDLNCERMVTQALFDSFRSGRLLMIDPENFESVVSVPNLALADAVKKTYEDTAAANKDVASFRSARINFMKEAVATFYNFGKFKKAEEYFKILKKDDPGMKKYSTVESFVMEQWADEVKHATVKKANEVISGLIFRSIYYLVYGDEDAALANERMARYIYRDYQTGKARGQEARVGLLPYADIKKAVTENCLNAFPPAMAAVLRAKMAAEKADSTAKSLPGGLFRNNLNNIYSK